MWQNAHAKAKSVAFFIAVSNAGMKSGKQSNSYYLPKIFIK